MEKHEIKLSFCNERKINDTKLIGWYWEVFFVLKTCKMPISKWKYHIFFRYRIVDLDDQYKVDLNMSICYADTYPCDYNMILWTDTLINKTMCELSAGFLDSGWSFVLG